MKPFRIIDISQPVQGSTACFPGDVPFSKSITVSHQESQVINLSAFTMSPHVGTHADAPVHVRGSMEQSIEAAGHLPLSPFIGSAAVVDVSPWEKALAWEQVRASLEMHANRFGQFPERVLFKTARQIRYDTFETHYAWLSPQLVRELEKQGVVLVGLDTPSVDAVDSKTLETHHALLDAGICWLENLDFTQLVLTHEKPADYFLVAAPLKFMELEASPVRAVLLEFQPTETD